MQAKLCQSLRVPFYTNATVFDLAYGGGLDGNGTGEARAVKELRCGGCGT
jgi:hypothetical protein